ncbi:MAG: hypothetical protein GYA41_13435 [Bacteroidales bacterium]|nr:hypothetical protein [Bacteroidales bacterium]
MGLDASSVIEIIIHSIFAEARYIFIEIIMMLKFRRSPIQNAANPYYPG